MGDINWFLMGFQIITDLLLAGGLWMILKKCNMKGWHGLIPGLRFYDLGIVGGRESEGWMAMVFDALNALFRFGSYFISADAAVNGVWMLLWMVAAITDIVYEVRVMDSVIRTFDAPKRYSFLWVIMPWYVAAKLGFSVNYEPVNLGRYNDDEALAGTAPADIDAAIDDDPSDDGLVIHLRSRVVRTKGRRRYLLKDINLTIPNGSLVLLLGGSGAGKTTLINAVIGYEKANAQVSLNGVNIYRHYDEMKYKIGYVPQQDLLRLNDSVRRTLADAALFRLPKDIKPAERAKRLEDVVETLGMTGRDDGLVAKKSGGQKKRISIGMELIADPELFILDEPDSGLDGVIARELFERLRDVADQGKIVIAITHTPDRVVDLFDKVIVLARDSGRVGRLAFYGTPDEAKEFFEKDSMERIVMSVNSTHEGGEGRADEFIEKFAHLKQEGGALSNG